MAACFVLAGPALADVSTGSTMFTSDRASYVGQYNAADRAISVDIDGLLYSGHYAARAAYGSAAPSGNARAGGQWGRAFLMASSAKVLQCQLDAGFPQVSGLCQDSDGRKFALGQPASR